LEIIMEISTIMLIVIAVAALGFVAYYMMSKKETPAEIETRQPEQPQPVQQPEQPQQTEETPIQK